MLEVKKFIFIYKEIVIKLNVDGNVNDDIVSVNGSLY